MSRKQKPKITIPAKVSVQNSEWMNKYIHSEEGWGFTRSSLVDYALSLLRTSQESKKQGE